jgi:hypothetical protein
MNTFKPSYSVINQKNKDILFIVHYAEHSTVHATNAYNSAGQSYFGVELSGFVETFRGLLRVFPNFLEVLGHDPKSELKELGFVEVEPTDLEKMLYDK